MAWRNIPCSGHHQQLPGPGASSRMGGIQRWVDASLRAQTAQAVDLLKRYPTTMTAGDAHGDRARTWEFTDADIYQVMRFQFEVGTSPAHHHLVAFVGTLEGKI